ncbi:MAG: hypothetical protein ACPGVT_00540 [Maricaulaceae bacterium]
MSRYDDEFGSTNEEDFGQKFKRFLRYLSTRKMECWGFFAAGFLISAIF